MFTGEYRLIVPVDNLDTYLKEMGKDPEARQMAACGMSTRAPMLTVTPSGPDRWTMTLDTAFNTSHRSFKVDRAFVCVNPDGPDYTTIITGDGNTWTQTDDRPETIVREFSDTGMIATFMVNGVTMIQHYVRLVPSCRRWQRRSGKPYRVPRRPRKQRVYGPRLVKCT